MKDRGLIMLRHGETTYNATRRMQGQLDTELSERGVEQAVAAAHKLGHLPISRVISSDLRRAAETAKLIGARLDMDIEIDPRLRETHLGLWQGRTHDEVDVEFPGKRATWRNSPGWAPPEGESRLDVAARARPVIDELLADHTGWPGTWVVIVAHGGAISALTSNLLGFQTEQYPLLTGLKNTAASVLVGRPRFGVENPDVTNGDAQWYFRGWNVFGEV